MHDERHDDAAAGRRIMGGRRDFRDSRRHFITSIEHNTWRRHFFENCRTTSSATGRDAELIIHT